MKQGASLQTLSLEAVERELMGPNYQTVQQTPPSPQIKANSINDSEHSTSRVTMCDEDEESEARGSLRKDSNIKSNFFQFSCLPLIVSRTSSPCEAESPSDHSGMTWNSEDYEHIHYLCSPDGSYPGSVRSSVLGTDRSEREYDTCNPGGSCLSLQSLPLPPPPPPPPPPLPPPPHHPLRTVT